MIKYVQIEVEDIRYVTTEGEASSSEEEIPVVQNKACTLKELKKKRTCKPFGGVSQKRAAQS